MRLRAMLVGFFHRRYCGTSRVRLPEDECSCCYAEVADVYVTVGCWQCKAPGKPMCWACTDAIAGLTLTDVTVFPGRERGAA